MVTSGIKTYLNFLIRASLVHYGQEEADSIVVLHAAVVQNDSNLTSCSVFFSLFILLFVHFSLQLPDITFLKGRE